MFLSEPVFLLFRNFFVFLKKGFEGTDTQLDRKSFSDLAIPLNCSRIHS
jgi:hypothetical protein